MSRLASQSLPPVLTNPNKSKPSLFDVLLPFLCFSVFVVVIYFAFLPPDFHPIKVTNLPNYPFGDEFMKRLNTPINAVDWSTTPDL